MPIISGVKTDAITIGKSTTDSQNFQLSANNDGTAKLARGSDGSLGDILTIDASGVVVITNGYPISGGSTTERWIKYQDGTLIQTGRIAPATNNNTGTSYTFPTAFFDTNYAVSVNAIGISSSAVSGSYVAECASLTTTTCLVKVLAHGSSTTVDAPNIPIMITAIGRWKA
jgi:hypothetical protein